METVYGMTRCVGNGGWCGGRVGREKEKWGKIAMDARVVGGDGDGFELDEWYGEAYFCSHGAGVRAALPDTYAHTD